MNKIKLVNYEHFEEICESYGKDIQHLPTEVLFCVEEINNYIDVIKMSGYNIDFSCYNDTCASTQPLWVELEKLCTAIGDAVITIANTLIALEMLLDKN